VRAALVRGKDILSNWQFKWHRDTKHRIPIHSYFRCHSNLDSILTDRPNTIAKSVARWRKKPNRQIHEFFNTAASLRCLQTCPMAILAELNRRPRVSHNGTSRLQKYSGVEGVLRTVSCGVFQSVQQRQPNQSNAVLTSPLLDVSRISERHASSNSALKYNF